MRDLDTEILLEEYFNCENMTIDERNFIITFLYNTKTIKDNTNMRIVTCNFKKVKDNIYKANGAMCSEDNNANWFDSYIEIDDNKLSIRSDITELCPSKELTEYSIFTKTGDNEYKRHTKYSHNDKQYEDEIIIDNFDIIYDDNDKSHKNKI